MTPLLNPKSSSPALSLTEHKKDSGNETLLAGEHSTVEGQNALNLQVAAIIIRARIKREQLTPWHRDDDELLWGGHLSRGLWIYRRPDRTLDGMNYDSLERLEQGTIEEHAKFHNYPSDLNACAEFEKTLTEEQQVIHISKLSGFSRTAIDVVQIRSLPKLIFATAEQRCRAFVALHEGKSVQ